MNARASHDRLERVLADAMRADDPVRALRDAARDPLLSVTHREALARVNEDGVRVQALLVAKLRFDRLLNGSLDAAALFEDDPRSFSELFRRYHRETPLDAFFPRAEGERFAAWIARQP